MNHQSSDELKRTLKRIVSMLTRMAMKFDGVADSPVDYARAIDYEYEHRDAEHEQFVLVRCITESVSGSGAERAAMCDARLH